MVCLYCGKKLTMVKKLTSEDFCSVAHRQIYHSEQETLAVARLVEQQRRMTPARKPTVVAMVAPAAVSPHPGEYLSQKIHPRDNVHSLWLSSQQPAIALLPIELMMSASSALSTPAAPSLPGQAQAPVSDSMRALSKAQASTPPSPSPPSISFRAYRPTIDACAPPQEAASEQNFALFVLRQCAIPPSNSSLDLGEARIAPDFDFEEPDSSPIDLSQNLCPKPPRSPVPVAAFGAKRFAFSRLPEAHSQSSFNPSPHASTIIECPAPDPVDTPRQLQESPANRFKIADPAPQHPTSQVRLHAELSALADSVAFNCEFNPLALIDLESGTLPQIRSFVPPAPSPQLEIAILWPSLRLDASGTIQRIFARPKPNSPRLPRLIAAAAIASSPPPPPTLPAATDAANDFLPRLSGNCHPFDAAMPYPLSFLRPVSAPGIFPDRVSPIVQKARVAGVRRSSLEVTAVAFRLSQMVAVPVQACAGAVSPRLRDAVAMERLSIFRPQLRFAIIPAREYASPFSALSELSGGKFTLSFAAMRRRWAEAPNDLRWITLAVPIVIGLIWFANSPGVKDNAKHSVSGTLSSIAPNVTGLLNTSFGGDSLAGIRVGIQRRAAVELSDDFRQGLGEWSGKGNWARGWNYDPAGFIRPRQIALYTPTIALEDYRFEFLGAIEKKALSWVFRAADLKNYYVSRLEMTKGGPLPTVELVRFAVIDGRAGPRKSIPLPFQGRLDTIYRVSVDVRGTDFVTTVQGQIVDVFSDDRLARGGIGFYTEAGEDARLRWVEVSHQYDFLGRLCAFLVPYNVLNSNVRSEP